LPAGRLYVESLCVVIFHHHISIMKKIIIGLVGDYNPEVTAHKAIPLALKLSSEKLNRPVEYFWLDTDLINKKYFNELNSLQALWAVPATTI
jgi:CTP synthase (UTP-ammonia lyase)